MVRRRNRIRRRDPMPTGAGVSTLGSRAPRLIAICPPRSAKFVDCPKASAVPDRRARVIVQGAHGHAGCLPDVIVAVVLVINDDSELLDAYESALLWLGHEPVTKVTMA